MAWSAAHLFARCEAQQTLVAALEPLLGDAAHQLDRERLLDAPPPLLVGPVHEGWVVISGLRGWVDDLAWLARALSRAAGVERVVSSELLGAFYRLRHAEHAGGETTAEVISPEAGSWTGEAVYDGPMPLYRDVEQLALALLLDQGIPRELALLGTCPFDRAEEEPVVLGMARCLRREGESIVGEERPLRALRFAADEAPVLPKEVGRDFGLVLFDDRYVEGQPTEAAVKRLLLLEQKICERARRQYAAPGLNLTLSYFNGRYQEELDALLRAHDRHVAQRAQSGAERPPWWAFWKYFGRWG